MLSRALAAAAALVAVLAADARAAGDPIMPLAEVKPGMQCNARSVLRGTAISTFNIEVVDIVSTDPDNGYILVRAHGPEIERTGLGPGFSGSPIYCDGRVIGAISESVGEYGNSLALATPIQEILGEPVDLPAETRRAPRGKPLAAPLSVGGLSPRVQTLVQRAARTAKRVIYATPARPRASLFPPQTLRPGSAFSAGIASGAFTAGAIGTVAYVDGDRVWGFGHPLDAVGRRSLLLQDAYVFTVVNNPVGAGDTRTYKYATSGNDLGTVTNDAASAVVGRTGALPPRFPLRVVATDLDSGKVRVANTSVVDESALGLPTGISALTEIGSIALTELAYQTLKGLPLRQSGSMCVRISVRERARPLRFCNSYVGGSALGEDLEGGAPIVSDFASATGLIDAFNFGPLHITGVDVNLKLRRSLRLAYLTRIVKAPLIVQRGKRYRVTLEIQRQNGPKSRRVVTLRVPRSTPAGPRALSITGTAPDTSLGSGSLDDALAEIFNFSDDDGGSEDLTGPRTVNGLAERIAGIHRDDAVFAAFPPLGQGALDALEQAEGPTGAEVAAQKPRPIHRDPQLRIAGERKRRIFVLP